MGVEVSSVETTTVKRVEEFADKVVHSKSLWLDWAEIFDAWRVVPRTILYSYAGWAILVTDRTLTWYFHLPSAERSGQDAALVGTIITAVTGLFTLTLNFYQNSGRQWPSGKSPT